MISAEIELVENQARIPKLLKRFPAILAKIVLTRYKIPS